MRQASSAFFRAALSLVALCGTAGAVPAQTTLLSRADVVCPDTAKADVPDAPSVALPFHSAGLGCRARVRFDAPGAPPDDWAVYLPYLYGGGNVQLNGMPVAAIRESGAGRVVRWERPFLIRLPREQLHAGSNELVLHVAVEPVARRAIVPRFEVGPQAALADAYEARLFWVRTMSQITTVCAWVIGVLVLVIWWYRHDEMLYGLFGVASLLWGVRSLNLVIESVPEPWWAVWRLTYLASTGGFALALSVFQWRLAGIRVPRVERALIVYGLACPVLFVLAPGNDALVGQAWTAGLLPVIAAATLALGLEAWRRPTGERVALCSAVCVALVAGAHDFLVHASSPLLSILAPRAAADRLFLLQYSADLLLLVMGGCLCARFVRTLDQLTTLSRTLEQRVAARELALTEKFQIIGALEKRHATDEERQRILRDLHDGLGSQLFVTLSRVETGAIARGEVADALRMCLADMRLTFEVMGPENGDFVAAWGDFRHRWERQLTAAGVESAWRMQPDDAGVMLKRETALQFLRIAQEALTNVLKHAQARQVSIELRMTSTRLCLDIRNDGRGFGRAPGHEGRGLRNMQSRARRAGARLEVDSGELGTVVRLEIEGEPLP